MSDNNQQSENTKPILVKKKSLEDPTVKAKTISLVDKNELADPPHTFKNVLALMFVTLFFLIAFFGALYLQDRLFY